MAPPTISVNDIYNIFPHKKEIVLLPLIKIELIIEIRLAACGLVKYSDENGRPWIKEFNGNIWEKEIYLKKPREIKFSVFINNQFLQKNNQIILTKKIDNAIVDQKKFLLSGDKLFDGWYTLF